MAGHKACLSNFFSTVKGLRSDLELVRDTFGAVSAIPVAGELLAAFFAQPAVARVRTEAPLPPPATPT